MESIFVLMFMIFSQSFGWSISVQEFQKCASSFNHGTPSIDIAQAFIEQAVKHGNITSRLEAFMAISEMSWESVGFTARAEYACSNGHWSSFPCDTYDTKGCPAGNKYYGRGFLQITHCYNYRAADKEFPGIVKNPDLVAKNDSIAMGTALFMWREHVHSAPGVEDGHFGSATRAIDGFYECSPGNYTLLAKERWNRFNACIKAVNVNNSAKEEGCYESTTALTTPKESDYKLGNCRSANGEPQYNQWCGDDCPHGNCPATICKCG